MGLFLTTSAVASGGLSDSQLNTPGNPLNAAPISVEAGIPNVPYISQLTDISAVEWRKQGCGVASLAMLIEFYRPGTVSVNTLLKQGIASGAYLEDAGWKHRELGLLAGRYDLEGKNFDLAKQNSGAAFAQFESALKDGPVIASIFYKFNPKSTLPHLVVIKGIEDGMVYYNDPSGDPAGEKISIPDFMKGWKKRFITVREIPVS